MKKHFQTLLFLVASQLVLTGCKTTDIKHPLFEPSSFETPDSSTSFDEYLKQTEQRLNDNRYFLTEDTQTEVQANMPFELEPEVELGSSKGILLIHGLGDSPFSFVDVGAALAEQGFLVRTILLEGHGTRPGDMINADHENWQAQVSENVELLKDEVDEVYLGGFSTGGNLAYLHAVDDPEIKGLALFSPGFMSDEPLVRYTPIAAIFKDWLRDLNPESEVVYTRYMAMPTNGFAQYYKTSAATLDRLEDETFDRPVFMALSEHDSVLESEIIRDLFLTRFTSDENQLVWFGSEPSSESGRVRVINSSFPDLRIVNMSHMGMLFSPGNPYYGIDGPGRICRNGQQAEGADAHCRGGGEVWYGAWGTQKEGEVVARLTFNPAFDLMMDDLLDVLDSQKEAESR